MNSTIRRFFPVLLVGFGLLAQPLAASAQEPAASPAATAPASKPRNPTFHGNIDAADAAAMTFTLKGKKNTRTFTVTPATKLLKRTGGEATWADLKAGEYVTGSAKKTGEDAYQAVSVKVGPKPETAASPAPAKKPRKKKAEAAPSPAQ